MMTPEKRWLEVEVYEVDFNGPFQFVVKVRDEQGWQAWGEFTSQKKANRRAEELREMERS